MLLSYDGNDTIARISPVCGFMTTVTPWLTLAASMPHFSARVARRWVRPSIVSMRFFPGDRLAHRLDDVQQPARRVALDQLHAVVSAELILEGRSTPALPMTSSRR